MKAGTGEDWEQRPVDAAYRLCLVGGTGRSGTTLLRQIFSLHPSVATLASEARFLTDPDGIVDFHASLSAYWSPYVFDVKARRLEKLLRELGRSGKVASSIAPGRGGAMQPVPNSGLLAGSLKRSLIATLGGSSAVRLLPRYWAVNLRADCPSYDRLVDELIERLVAFEFSGRWMGTPRSQASSVRYGLHDATEDLNWFCRAFVACVCQRQHASHFIEDTPFNLLAFAALQRLLPESRLVHIYRDPRDVIASYMHRRWSPTDPELAARFYVGVMQRWEAIRDALPSHTYIEVALNALVQEPETVLRRICMFWDLPWDPLLLDADLTRSNSGRWRTDIPSRALESVRSILGPYLARYGD